MVLNGRDPDRLAKAAAEIPGDRVHTAVFDVTDGPRVADGIADVEERVGPLDILVNNAGMRPDSSGYRSRTARSAPGRAAVPRPAAGAAPRTWSAACLSSAPPRRTSSAARS